MKRGLVLIICAFFLSNAFSQTLFISEVMFYEPQTNCEFIELYNPSQTDSVDAAQFKIKYYTNSPDLIVAGPAAKTKIPPGGFAVILEGDYDFANGIYNARIPSTALILKISDNAFGSSGMANTTSRPIYLLNAANQIVDSVIYNANNQRGYSEEKVNLNEPFSQGNWANSTVYLGTPGYKNSVSPRDYDVGISSLSSIPSLPKANQTFVLSAVVKNYGIRNASNVIVLFFKDDNKDSVGQAEELIDQKTILNINPSEEISVDCSIEGLFAGNYNFIAQSQLSLDENQDNDKRIISVSIQEDLADYNDIVINEIMYAPPTGQPEWVELYNKSDKTINLKNWKFSDNATTITLTTTDYQMPPKSYLIIAKDTSIKNFYTVKSAILTANLPALNNDQDACVLKTNLNTLIDSVRYFSSWGGTGGFSLERISFDDLSNKKENWGTSKSLQKATPGYINSLSEKEYDIEVARIIFSPSFPLKGQNVSFGSLIKNNGKFQVSNFKANLYLKQENDFNYQLVDSALIDLINSKDSIVINFSYQLQNLQTNYDVKIEAVFSLDQDDVNNQRVRKLLFGYPPMSIVINEIMYLPAGGEPEWIEFYNASNDTINLKDWELSDILTTPSRVKIRNDDFLVYPKTYFIVAYDSTITNYYYNIPSQIIYAKIPTLNNTEDGVILYDNRGAAIDSVRYNASFGGVSSKSLERIYFDKPSNDPTNWGASCDIENATPGRENSLTPKNFNLSIEKITTIPQKPRIGDNVKIAVLIKNIGLQKAENFEAIFMYSIVPNQWVLLGEIKNLSLNPGDSIFAISPLEINSAQQNFIIRADINYLNDQDYSDNQREMQIVLGLKEKIVLINEFKYAPKSPEPEWIEIVNVTEETINLKNWSISDVISPTKAIISSTDFFLNSGDYLIIAKDTNIFSFYNGIRNKTIIKNFGALGNTEDGIVIYDYAGTVIDSVYYRSKWGGTDGTSLERISFNKSSLDSSNWKPSLSRESGTPGRINSYNFIRSYSKNSLIINEIMFDPLAGKCEFVEFYNLCGDTLDLAGWKFIEESGSFIYLSTSFYKLPPFEYFVVASDSSIFDFNKEIKYLRVINASSLNLSNDKDMILLKDAFDNTIDSVYYSSKWHNSYLLSTKGRSLEKINFGLSPNEKLNWSSSVDPLGCTPGKNNSIFTTLLPQSANVEIKPNPFSPDQDGFEDFAIIAYNLTKPLSQIRIRIFDSQGRLVRTLADNYPSASSGSIVFDGFDDSGRPLKIGIYILLLEAISDNFSVVETVKKPFVIARKL